MEATLQNIFNSEFDDYIDHHGISADQYNASKAIMECQTPVLGHEEWGCTSDGYVEQQNHSCRHRSCPRCQYAYTRNWLDKTQARLLDCSHYHVVFSLPHELNEVWQYNRAWSANHLFKASAETLQQLLKDERYLGADVGLLASLHTWGRTLSFHPHLHVLVTGGGIKKGKWKGLEKDFLLPVGVLKAKFKGKWLSWLNGAYEKGVIERPGHWSESDWKRTLSKIAKKSWNVRIQGPYHFSQGVVNYLAKYVHGGPIKDHRIEKSDMRSVVFKYRDHYDNKEKRMTLKTANFISRVLWHVPVKGQHNVRYYGVYVPGATAKRELVRSQLGTPQGEHVQRTEKKEKECPICGHVLLHRSSTRRKISYIKNNSLLKRANGVQQAVEADRNRDRTIFSNSFGFFYAQKRPLN